RPSTPLGGLALRRASLRKKVVRSASDPHVSPDRWTTPFSPHARCMLVHFHLRRLRMRTFQYAAAIAFGLSSSLLANMASAQDTETLKPLRDKSLLKIEYKAPTDKKLEPIYQRLKGREVL